jgi:two-component system response regulator NreC
MTVQLSARQTEILALMAKGHTQKSIARELGLSVGTVHNHQTATFLKLGVHKGAQAVAVALREGLIQDEPPEIPVEQQDALAILHEAQD